MITSTKNIFNFSNSLQQYCFIAIILSFFLFALCFDNVMNHGGDISSWDLLLITGVLVFIPAVRIAFYIPDKLEKMLTRLVDRGSLNLANDSLSSLKKDMERIANKWSKSSGIIMALAMFIVFLKAFGFSS